MIPLLSEAPANLAPSADMASTVKLGTLLKKWMSGGKLVAIHVIPELVDMKQVPGHAATNLVPSADGTIAVQLVVGALV
jgi:hypothetical protein